VDGNPRALLPLALFHLLQFVYANLRVERASGNNGAELRPRPFHLPRRCALNANHLFLHPLLAPLDKSPNSFIAAHCRQPSPSPIEAHVVDDDIGGQVSDDIYTSVLIHRCLINDYSNFQQW
jgi:hypothetical protein